MKLFQLLAVTVCVICFTDAQAQTAPVLPVPAKRTQVKAQSAPAHPQDPKKFDTSLPVEISSDSLEVLQKENKAIFKGDVVAVQGQVRLKSDVMIVHYKQQGGDKTNTASAVPVSVPQPVADDKAAPGAPGEMGAVTLIEVQGNVFMATPEESAKGDKGDYQVATRTLHLFGSNVVLTRDKNIMRGTALTYNMETGRSILTDSGNVVNGKSTTGGRVHSVFVPNQEPAPTPAAKTGNTKQGNNAPPQTTGGQ